MWPSIKKALGRSRRGIRIDPMELSVVLGGQEEPADAAQQYGTLQGTVWTVVPALEQLLVLPHPRIHIDIDFSAETVRASGQVGLSRPYRHAGANRTDAGDTRSAVASDLFEEEKTTTACRKGWNDRWKWKRKVRCVT